MNSKVKGDRGEKRAARFLQESGYLILSRNYRTRSGEIDIIAFFEQQIVFVEVKSWNRNSIADLEYSIDRRKQRRLLQTAKHFMAMHPEYQAERIRFDIVFLHGDMREITHIQDAFGG